ncbi:MAG: hypothetical protein ACREJ3_02630 [Polyangiaceae bacterium]
MRRWRLPRAVALLATMTIAIPAVLVEPTAAASVSVAVTWTALLHASKAAAVVTARESVSVWENGRIATYTRVEVDRGLAGDVPAREAWVRTLGGVVGHVGQIVEGEAVFAPGKRSLVFLCDGPSGAYDVTARGQGQFPVVDDDDRAGPAHVIRSQSLGLIIAPRGVAPTSSQRGALKLAADIVHGRTIDDVAAEVASAWSAAHAERP